MRHLCVALAALEEKESLQELIPRFLQVLGQQVFTYDFVFAIDGTDGTTEWLREYLEAGQYSCSISHSSTRRGVGLSLREAFSRVPTSATHVLTMDCDLNHDPEELPQLLQAYRRSGADIVVGSRYSRWQGVSSHPLWKRVASVAINGLVSRVSGLAVRDKTSGYRLMTKRAADLMAAGTTKNDFSVYPEMLIVAASRGYTIEEVSITFRSRIHGTSKLPKLRTTVGYLGLITGLAIRRSWPWHARND